MTPKIEIYQDLGVELPPDVPYMDLRKRAQSACNTIELLRQHGAQYATSGDDEDDYTLAGDLVVSYAEDFEKASKHFTDKALEDLSVTTIGRVNFLIDEFGREAMATAMEVRNLVKNRLIIESDNPDPRIRLKAVELLGKMPEVGAFLERSETTINHKNSGELVDSLKKKLTKLTQNDEGIYEAEVDNE